MAAQKRSRRPPPAPAATRLLLIRHGEVEARYQKKFGGWIDMNLSPNGRRQARTLAGYLHRKTIDAVYCSPMKRVQQTAAPALKLNRHAQTILPALREINFGAWTGLGWQEVEDRFQFQSHEWLDQIHRRGVPDGESGAQFRARVEPCLRRIITRHRGQNVALFCHGGVIRMILALLLKLPLPKTNHFDIEYASITQVALHPHMAEIELMNFTPLAGFGGMNTARPLWRISVVTTAEAEDAVGELLASLSGQAAATWFDLKTRTSRVSVFVRRGKNSPAPGRGEIAAGLARLKKFGLDPGRAEIQISRLKREDWAESWKKHFPPIEIKVRRKPPGRRPAIPGAPPARYDSLLVKPSWSKKRPAANQAVVVLDPGLSFGTGQHPTTAFCLREIVRCHETGPARSFLDIGTGSGILAIAAARLGYAPVHAFDFDPECIRVAGRNARQNRVTGRLTLARGDLAKLPLQPARQYDLVCANLISTLLIAQRRRIVNRLKRGGTLVLAGILASEFAEVERAFSQLNLRLHSSRVEKEWQSGSFYFI